MKPWEAQSSTLEDDMYSAKIKTKRRKKMVYTRLTRSRACQNNLQCQLSAEDGQRQWLNERCPKWSEISLGKTLREFQKRDKWRELFANSSMAPPVGQYAGNDDDDDDDDAWMLSVFPRIPYSFPIFTRGLENVASELAVK